jgi:uncharacterized damage-inducible protein DinB
MSEPVPAPAASGRDFGAALLAEAERRLLRESLPRLERCLEQLSEEEIWQRPNLETVSIGNLVLHLAGNVRQWILSGLGGADDRRVREREFTETGPLPTSALVALIESTLEEAREVLARVDPASLLAPRRVQGFEESGLSILVHVVEHFSYHVGQVVYAVKSRKAIDLGFYRGVDLDRKG